MWYDAHVREAASSHESRSICSLGLPDKKPDAMRAVGRLSCFGAQMITPSRQRWSAEHRFWSSIVVVENCWEWCGYRDRDGYGRMRTGHRMSGAHRFAYELLRGPIPSGLEIDHICRNRGCVNPAHMEAVPHSVNASRGMTLGATNLRKTHCKNGHPLDGVWSVSAGGGVKLKRYCKTCRGIRALADAGEDA